MAEDTVADRSMKPEPDVLSISPVAELLFLRSRVQDLERENVEMAAENQRLKDLLVKEIPCLLSTMRQTLSADQHHHSASTLAISSIMGGDHGNGLVQWREQSPNPVPSISESTGNGREEVNGETDFEHSMAPGDSGVGGSDFELCDEVDGELCPVTYAADDNGNLHTYPSSPCDSADMFDPRGHRKRGRKRGTGKANKHIRQVEIYPGSGIFCGEKMWQRANQTRSPTAMVRTLLMGVFDMDTLLNSNLRGGRSRRPSYPNQHAPLDPLKLNAIYDATLARFPSARKGQIGTGINSKLSEIRFRSRNRKREQLKD